MEKQKDERKSLKLCGDNILCRGVLKKSSVLTPETKGRAIDKVEIYDGGQSDFAKGTKVRVNPEMFQRTDRMVDPFETPGQVDLENEFFLIVKADEIIGTF